MKRTILCMLLCFVGFLTTAAQPQKGKFNPREFIARLETFITNEAGFTSSEAQAFYPIYHEMKEKQRQMQQRMFELRKNVPANGDDKAFANIVTKTKALNVEIAQTEDTYYKKMCKAVPAQKVYKAMIAEDKFHRMMLDEYNRHKQNNERQRNRK